MIDSTCDHDPSTVHGAIGMYHCPLCGEMQIAGLSHTKIMEVKDWDEMDDYLKSKNEKLEYLG